MYGVPANLTLVMFDKATLIQICLGEFQLQFHFQNAEHAEPNSTRPSISVEGDWELLDGSGKTVDRGQSNAEREAYRLHRLLGKRVVGTELDPPRSFALKFEGGHVLRIFDDSEKYESSSIQPGDIFV
jgi:hypothetical protein